MLTNLQKIGKSLMLPIAVLPAAGLLLGIGGVFSNINTINAYPFLNNYFLQAIFKIMATCGEIIFVNLALLICIGIVIGLAKQDKGTAALSAVFGFLVMNASIKGMSTFFEYSKNIDTGVMGSLIIGIVVAHLHNKYNNIQLPDILGFFGGSRFVPIISSLCAIFVGLLFFLIWPTFQEILIKSGKAISELGIFGTFIYGFLLRLTGALGLHHMIYPLFWLTELGGIEEVAGQTIAGAQNIFFAQLADPNHTGLFTSGTRFFAGRFATMMFGLPGACLGMYLAAKKDKQKEISGILLCSALTSFITGITEPIEFLFLFVAPPLYFLHAFFDGISFALADYFNISIGNTFSGGVIDFILFGVLQGNQATNWNLVPIIGFLWFCLYTFSFKILIEKFNIKTPGREDGNEEIKFTSKKSINETARSVLEAFGGKNNIIDLDACITRLRVIVKDKTKINKELLKSLGAVGVLEVNNEIQAVFGAKADRLKQQIHTMLYNE